MKNSFLETVYDYYPKGINFYTDRRDVNKEYTNSKQYQRLQQETANYFGRGPDFAVQIMKELLRNDINIEFRDATRIVNGDRAFCIQHSGFFFEKELKYYPLCFVFSGLIPFFFSYYVDIDISFEQPIGQGSYKWENNNGIYSDFRENLRLKEVEFSVSEALSSNLGFKRFPDSLVSEVIPDIGNNNVEYGQFTFFNAFFADDFFCLP